MAYEKDKDNTLSEAEVTGGTAAAETGTTATDMASGMRGSQTTAVNEAAGTESAPGAMNVAQKNTRTVQAPVTPNGLQQALAILQAPEGAEETAAQKKRRERRERNNALVRSIGDGLSALTNLYYSTRGAGTPNMRNAQNDLTAGYEKQRQLLEAQREKNRQAWETYRMKKAQLTADAYANQAKLDETTRHNQTVEEISRMRADDTSADRKEKNRISWAKVDLSKLKLESDDDYRNAILDIREQEKDGRLKRWEAQNAADAVRAKAAETRANKASGSSSGKNSTAGYWNEYFTAMDEDGGGQIRTILRSIGQTQVDNKNVRYVMDRYHGRKSSSSSKSSTSSSTTTTKKKKLY